MKFSKLFLTVVLFSILISCSKDDKELVVSEDSLIGNWVATAINYSGTSRTVTQFTNMDPVDVSLPFTGEGTNIDLTVSFTKDPNNFTSSGTYDIIMTVAGQESIFPLDNFILPGTWEVSRDKLTIMHEGYDPQNATITQISENAFTMNWTYELDSIPYPGISITYNVNGSYSFERKNQ